MKILTDEQMRKCDRDAIMSGISSRELMYRAAQSVYDSHDWHCKCIYIICGKGNNGGDGYALACILNANGYKVKVYYIENNKGDALYYRDRALLEKIDISDISDCDYRCDIIVDCIFGTGFKGAIDCRYSDIIDNINMSGAYIVSVDIPSGLNGTSGIGLGSVKADKTVAIQCAKTGHYFGDGKDRCGQLIIKDIGIDISNCGYRCVDGELIDYVFAKRLSNSNKSTFGKSVVIGGCINYCGAVKLANIALCSMRAGCGLSTLAVPRNIAPCIGEAVMESTLYPLNCNEDGVVYDCNDIDELARGASVVVIGMGLGRNVKEIQAIIKHLISIKGLKVIIDADGLNALSTNVDILREIAANVLITPHPKEMSRLCGLQVQDVLADPIAIAESFAREYNVNVLLKGSSTFITDGTCGYIMTEGGSFLSKGGNGDVLSGAIAGIAAQGAQLLASAAAASYLCAMCGREKSYVYGEQGVLPSDIAISIAEIVKRNR